MKVCIINASWGAWYPKGTQRLVDSLWRNGWAYDIRFWKDQPINEFFNPDFPYTIKMAAWIQAIWEGYDIIIWADCSIWAVSDPNVLVKIIENEGGYFLTSGFNLAQTLGDKDLAFSGMSRDEAETKSEVWSCLFGVDLRTEKGKIFSDVFIDAYKEGVFNTPREHSGMSEDPRFLFCRQDQSAASIAFHKAGFETMRHPGDQMCSHTEKDLKKNTFVTFYMRGGL